MSDEMDLTPMDEDEGEYIEETGAPIEMIQETLEYFLDSASVDAVYGEPVENGDTVIIPAAEVLSGLAFGVGYGYGDSQGDEDGNGQGTGGGGGGGGGGRILSRPVAVIISSPEGVRVEPVVDPTKIVIAALTTVGFMFAMMMRMRRGHD